MFVAFLQSLSKGSEAEVRDQIVDIRFSGPEPRRLARLDSTGLLLVRLPMGK